MSDSSDFKIDIDDPIPVEASEVGENEETQFKLLLELDHHQCLFRKHSSHSW